MNTLNFIFALCYVFCVIYALISDYTRLIIPNWLVAVLGIGFLSFALAGGVQNAWMHFLAAAVVFLVFFVFFALGLVRAGDTKLIGALMLWAGVAHGIQLVTLFTVLGGVFALVLLILRGALVSYPVLGTVPGLGRFSQWARQGIMPYGLPIGVAALLIAPSIFNPVQ